MCSLYVDIISYMQQVLVVLNLVDLAYQMSLIQALRMVVMRDKSFLPFLRVQRTQ